MCIHLEAHVPDLLLQHLASSLDKEPCCQLQGSISVNPQCQRHQYPNQKFSLKSTELIWFQTDPKRTWLLKPSLHCHCHCSLYREAWSNFTVKSSNALSTSIAYWCHYQFKYKIHNIKPITIIKIRHHNMWQHLD